MLNGRGGIFLVTSFLEVCHFPLQWLVRSRRCACFWFFALVDLMNMLVWVMTFPKSFGWWVTFLAQSSSSNPKNVFIYTHVFDTFVKVGHWQIITLVIVYKFILIFKDKENIAIMWKHFKYKDKCFIGDSDYYSLYIVMITISKP